MSIYTTYSDEQLIVLLGKDDDRIAFEEVFHRYNKRLFPHVLKFVRSHHIAEEIMQEVFTRLWLKRSAVSSMDNPTAWLFTVASNLSLDFLKKEANQKKILSDLFRTAQLSAGEEYIATRENEEQLHLAINALPQQRQTIFRLSREKGMSHSQISKLLNISSSTVNNQLVSALHHIRRHMKKAGILMLALFFF